MMSMTSIAKPSDFAGDFEALRLEGSGGSDDDNLAPSDDHLEGLANQANCQLSPNSARTRTFGVRSRTGCAWRATRALGTVVIGALVVILAGSASPSTGLRRARYAWGKLHGFEKEGALAIGQRKLCIGDDCGEAQMSQEELSKVMYVDWVVNSSTQEVPVRSGRTDNSVISGSRWRCDVFSGRRDGEWVKLQDGSGYVKIVDGHSAVVEEIFFENVSSEVCSGHDMHPIADEVTCKGAAKSLGLLESYNFGAGSGGAVKANMAVWLESMKGVDVLSSNLKEKDQVLVLSQNSNSRKGCFVFDGTKMFALGGKPSLQLCSSRAADCMPVVTTTTTTSSLTSTTVTSTTITTTSSTATTTSTSDDPSLFCFVFIMTNSYELPLVKAQLAQKVGVFQCNEWVVFSDNETSIGDNVSTISVGGVSKSRMGADPGSGFKMLLNTNNLLLAWLSVAETHYLKHEWVIKADADAVFFPGRLREHLRKVSSWRPDKGYFKNCWKFHSLQGPLEVFTKGAIKAFLEKEEHCWQGKCCSKALQFDHRGEDYFMNKCMRYVGASQMEDYGLLSDAYCGEHPSPCTNKNKVAFHPFKSKRKYFQCVADAMPWVAIN